MIYSKLCSVFTFPIQQGAKQLRGGEETDKAGAPVTQGTSAATQTTDTSLCSHRVNIFQSTGAAQFGNHPNKSLCDPQGFRT